MTEEEEIDQPSSPVIAINVGLTGCHYCGKVQPIPENDSPHPPLHSDQYSLPEHDVLTKHALCVRCFGAIHPRKQNSLQRSWAWLLTSIVFYIPANILPVMYTNQLGQQTGKTILGGVILLWEHGSEPIAAIIFIASVFVPLAKILALAWLCLTVQLRQKTLARERTILYRIVEFVGRWSMIDVFVVGLLASLIQMGNLMSIAPGPAALPFAVMVVLTMLSAHSFDTRLIWDRLS